MEIIHKHCFYLFLFLSCPHESMGVFSLKVTMTQCSHKNKLFACYCLASVEVEITLATGYHFLQWFYIQWKNHSPSVWQSTYVWIGISCRSFVSTFTHTHTQITQTHKTNKIEKGRKKCGYPFLIVALYGDRRYTHTFQP